MRIMIHICCAHCLAKVLTGLRAEMGAALAPLGYWFNPNIHPLIEYRRRLKAVKLYVERDPLPMTYEDVYGLVSFCERVHGAYETPARCARCYALRLSAAARAAREMRADAFTSTLITSRHQDHAAICAAGEAAAREVGVPFIYRDLRAVEPSPKHAHGLYHQSYCGCVFSEHDRYVSTNLHLYKGPE